MIRFMWAIVAPWTWTTLCFGGSSSSSTSTSTSYSVRDERIAAAEGANVVKAGGDLLTGPSLKIAGSGNSVESLSDDVVRAAFAYAANRDALAGETLENVLGATRAIYSQASDALTVAASAPRGQITERTLTLLVAGGLALLGLVAFRKKA